MRSAPASQISGKPTIAVGSSRVHAFEQRDPERLGLESAGAVERLLAFDVAIDLRIG